MIDSDLETLEEVKNWLNDDKWTNKEKIKNIVSMLFIDLSDEDKIELFYESGDDFDFYMNFVNSIDFIAYDYECGIDMLKLIDKKINRDS